MKILFSLVLTFFMTQSPFAFADANHSEQVLEKFAFGSCNKRKEAQPHWKNILNEEPDLWLWLGDAVYLDFVSEGGEIEAFNVVKNRDDYQELINKVPVIGTWDDHDYAHNNAGGDFSDKENSKSRFLDFIDESESSEVWNHPGVYQSKTYGTKGKKVEFLILDLRYFKDLSENSLNAKLLGDKQWDWIEDRFENSDADLIFIASSLTFTSNWVNAGFEGWHAYPLEWTRLVETVTKSNKRTVLLTGDRHYSEISAVPLINGKPLIEFMASGLNNTVRFTLRNPYRISKAAHKKDHYGVVKIDWLENQEIKLEMEIKSSENGNLLERVTKTLK